MIYEREYPDGTKVQMTTDDGMVGEIRYILTFDMYNGFYKLGLEGEDIDDVWYWADTTQFDVIEDDDTKPVGWTSSTERPDMVNEMNLELTKAAMHRKWGNLRKWGILNPCSEIVADSPPTSRLTPKPHEEIVEETPPTSSNSGEWWEDMLVD